MNYKMPAYDFGCSRTYGNMLLICVQYWYNVATYLGDCVYLCLTFFIHKFYPQ